jgi:hypothetical protein
MERLTLVYTFRHGRSPEEILELRRVRATRGRASSYGLKLVHSASEAFRVDEEVVFGGRLAATERHSSGGRTIYLRSLEFDRSLRRGQRHEFAVRSWVETDPDPDNSIHVELTLPLEELALHVNFRGPSRPESVWTYGPIADAQLAPATASGAQTASINDSGAVSMYVSQPEVGPIYGLTWDWGNDPPPRAAGR